MQTPWFRKDSSSETMQSWPRAVASLADIPVYFKIPADYIITPNLTFLFPDEVHRTAGRKTEHLVRADAEGIHIIRYELGKISTHTFTPSGLVSFRFGTVLLQSWITLVGTGESLHLTYNTSGKRLIMPLVDHIRSWTAVPAEAAPTIPERYEALRQQAFAFCSQLNDLTGLPETLRFIYQEPRTGRNAHGHLIALNGREFILIRESEQRISRKKSTGQEITIVPLTKSVTVELRDGDGNPDFRLDSPQGPILNANFSLDKRDELAEFVAALTTAISS